MKKRRLIPVILVKNGWVVQSRNFKTFQKIGNPTISVKRCSEWGSDELILLDISREEFYNNRQDINFKNNKSFLEILNEISKFCFMPLVAGGKIKTLKKIENFLVNGADKISINTEAILNSKFIKQASQEFGSQCIVVSIDVKKIGSDYKIFTENGSQLVNINLKDFLKKIQDFGAGEVLINSIDRDGSGKGFDIDLINEVEDVIEIPQVCCGGAGSYDHFIEVANKSRVDGIAAANFFQYIDQSVFLTKKKLFENNLNFRNADLIEI